MLASNCKQLHRKRKLSFFHWPYVCLQQKIFPRLKCVPQHLDLWCSLLETWSVSGWPWSEIWFPLSPGIKGMYHLSLTKLFMVNMFQDSYQKHVFFSLKIWKSTIRYGNISWYWQTYLQWLNQNIFLKNLSTKISITGNQLHIKSKIGYHYVIIICNTPYQCFYTTNLYLIHFQTRMQSFLLDWLLYFLWWETWMQQHVSAREHW